MAGGEGKKTGLRLLIRNGCFRETFETILIGVRSVPTSFQTHDLKPQAPALLLVRGYKATNRTA